MMESVAGSASNEDCANAWYLWSRSVNVWLHFCN